jgi:L-alanine-DL-glutamate epimerase-like enolase superfamily enzyme
LNIHSIEQPVAPQNSKLLHDLAMEQIIPIALDETLLYFQKTIEKIQILEEIKPQFIVLKPSLHGGLTGTAEWIKMAEERNIPWWMTSALEGSIGLSAIAQFTGNYSINLAQGLGTGGIFSNNLPSNLVMESGEIMMSK